MRMTWIGAGFSLALSFFASIANAQDQEPSDADALRRLRFYEAGQHVSIEQLNEVNDKLKLPGQQLQGLSEELQELGKQLKTPLASSDEPATWVLNPSNPRFNTGTFGIDLSHYEFDLFDTNNPPPECTVAATYGKPECSCSISWPALSAAGLRYVYFEATQGEKAYLSFSQSWAQLEPLHTTKKLFRGAYHFLLPNFLLKNAKDASATDATFQANLFLQSIGAVDGKKPAQLPPVLDIESTKTEVDPASPDWTQCPKQRQETVSGKHYCDMWHKAKSSKEIAGLVGDWISRVNKATGMTPIIYTNTDWWNATLSSDGEALVRERPLWIARYPLSGGPDYVSTWTSKGGNSKLGMPPLPTGAKYPSPNYNLADFWQFSETGQMQTNPFQCHRPQPKLDFNYIPVTGAQIETVFGVH